MICSTTLSRKKTLKASATTPTAAEPCPTSPEKVPPPGERWRIVPDHRTPVPSCVGDENLALSLCTSWRPRRRGSAQPAGRPTLDGQALLSTRRSTIIHWIRTHSMYLSISMNSRIPEKSLLCLKQFSQTFVHKCSFVFGFVQIRLILMDDVSTSLQPSLCPSFVFWTCCFFIQGCLPCCGRFLALTTSSSWTRLHTLQSLKKRSN